MGVCLRSHLSMCSSTDAQWFWWKPIDMWLKQLCSGPFQAGTFISLFSIPPWSRSGVCSTPVYCQHCQEVRCGGNICLWEIDRQKHRIPRKIALALWRALCAAVSLIQHRGDWFLKRASFKDIWRGRLLSLGRCLCLCFVVGGSSSSVSSILHLNQVPEVEYRPNPSPAFHVGPHLP